jgi:hypothetical protein
MLIDPRHGDVEDDAASPGQRSLLAIAGSLLAEISLPKLLFAWTVLLLVPAALLGLAPLLVSAWFSTLSQKFAALTGIGTAFALLAIAAVGWLDGGPCSDWPRPTSGRSMRLRCSPATHSPAKHCVIWRNGYRARS